MNVLGNFPQWLKILGHFNKAFFHFFYCSAMATWAEYFFRKNNCISWLALAGSIPSGKKLPFNAPYKLA